MATSAVPPSSPVRGELRANVMAAALVGAVVLVLGFGSGIGAVLSRHKVSIGKAAPSPATAPAAASEADVAASSPAASGSATAPAAKAVTARQSSSAFHPAAVASGVGSSAAASPAAKTQSGSAAAGASCNGEMVVNAMADPFVAHFEHAHLDESPAQQVADATNTDMYVRTHTVLFANMLMPGVTLAQASLQGVDPFVTHFNHAHLEESPAQQAADLLDVDRYVRTHTALIGDMTNPALSTATGGC